MEGGGGAGGGGWPDEYRDVSLAAGAEDLRQVFLDGVFGEGGNAGTQRGWTRVGGAGVSGNEMRTAFQRRGERFTIDSRAYRARCCHEADLVHSCLLSARQLQRT